jgi:hypothetical protein
MGDEHNTRRGLTRGFVLTLAVLSVLLLTQALTHSHEKEQTEAACHICQAAHFGAAPTAGVELPSIPLLAAGYFQPFVAALHQELFFHDCPFRAPPIA